MTPPRDVAERVEHLFRVAEGAATVDKAKLPPGVVDAGRNWITLRLGPKAAGETPPRTLNRLSRAGESDPD